MPSFRVFVILVVTLVVPRSAAAVMAFDGPKPIHDDESFSSDFDPVIAGDGSGNWVTIWSDEYISRSTDDGRTWTPVSYVNFQTNDIQVAESSAGTCIAVGYRFNAHELVFLRSSDHCVTWSSATPLFTNAITVPAISVTTDSAGHWMAVATYNNSSTSTREVASSYSDDDGLTWSAPTLIANTDVVQLDTPNIVTDGNGRWMALWVAYDHISRVAISTDQGMTWSAPATIGPIAGDPDLATDSNGTWIAVGVAGEYPDQQISAVISTDNGANWAAPVPFKELVATPYFFSLYIPRVRYQNGAWQVLWSQTEVYVEGTVALPGDPLDLFGVRSVDGGATWTDPAAVNANATKGESGPADLACGTNGTCILVAESSYSWLEFKVARSHDDCPAAPATGCHASTRPGASTINLLNPVGVKDKMLWNWKSGEATLDSELGDPRTTSSYVICLYDNVGGTMKNVFEADATAGPRWTLRKGGFGYHDPTGANGSLRKMTLKAGADGEAAIKIKASGPALAPPVMPFAMSPSVIAQVINTENGNCWESSFSDSQGNTATQLNGQSD